MMLSSKFTFSLIVIAALLVSGVGLMAQDAYADTTAQFDAPEFSAYTLTLQQLTFNLTNQLMEH